VSRPVSGPLFPSYQARLADARSFVLPASLSRSGSLRFSLTRSTRPLPGRRSGSMPATHSSSGRRLRQQLVRARRAARRPWRRTGWTFDLRWRDASRYPIEGCVCALLVPKCHVVRKNTSPSKRAKAIGKENQQRASRCLPPSDTEREWIQVGQDAGRLEQAGSQADNPAGQERPARKGRVEKGLVWGSAADPRLPPRPPEFQAVVSLFPRLGLRRR
jgi:hypothetical protein